MTSTLLTATDACSCTSRQLPFSRWNTAVIRNGGRCRRAGRTHEQQPVTPAEQRREVFASPFDTAV